VIFGLSLTLAALHSWHKPQTAKLIVRLVGVTNDLMGTNFAVFTLAGTGFSWIYLADPVVQLRHQPMVNGSADSSFGISFDSNQSIRGLIRLRDE
jgi:hypothetical protein